MIKKFEHYNESIRDKMTPKTDEEIIKSFGKMTPDQKVKNGYKHNILWLAEKGISEGGNRHPFGNYLSKALYNGWVDAVKFMVENNIDDIHQYEEWGVKIAADSGNANLVDLLINVNQVLI